MIAIRTTGLQLKENKYASDKWDAPGNNLAHLNCNVSYLIDKERSFTLLNRDSAYLFSTYFNLHFKKNSVQYFFCKFYEPRAP